MKHILCTGAAGFIGSHLIEHLLVNTDWKITCLDGLTYAGDVGRLTDSAYFDKDRVKLFWHDLSAPIPESMQRRIGPVDYIINVASASHIDQSISDPLPFVRNNVNVALHALDYARRTGSGLEVFIQISTDEVYGSVESGERLSEWAVINPSNPYSASKAAQEALAISFWRTYGVPVIIVNLMNNFGERQDREKFVPKVVRAVLEGKEVILHGSTRNIGSRYYLHARNAADALLFLIKRPVTLYPQAQRPDRYNVVGDRQVDNLEMAQRVAKILDHPLLWRLDHNPRSRPGHDLHYGLNGDKLSALGWKPPVDFEQSLKKTVLWMAEHPEW